MINSGIVPVMLTVFSPFAPPYTHGRNLRVDLEFNHLFRRNRTVQRTRPAGAEEQAKAMPKAAATSATFHGFPNAPASHSSNARA
jgi:hypothetical protein